MFIQTVTAALALAALPRTAWQEPEPAKAEVAPIVEDVEVMRRLLVRALQAPNVVQGTAAGQSDLVVSLSRMNANDATKVTHSRGFRVPGAGVFLSFDVGVPVETVPVEPRLTADSPRAGDVWEETLREVASGSSPSVDGEGAWSMRATSIVFNASVAQRRAWRLSEAEIGRAVDGVLRTLALHGARIRELGRSESVTVALYLSPGSLGGTPFAESIDLGVPTLNQTFSQRTAVGLFEQPAGASVRTQHVVIQLSGAELIELAGAEEPLAAAKRTARVHRY